MIITHFFGKKHTEDSRLKISLNNGNPKKAVLKFDKKTMIFIESFESIELAAKSVNGDPANIGKVCKKHTKYKSAYGFYWEFESLNLN